MGIFDLITGRNQMILSTIGCALPTNSKYQTLALEAGIKLIAKTVARAEFQTFLKGKEYKGTNYYILNVEANQNTSASLFWENLVSKLLTNGEALVLLQDNKNLYLADSFIKQEYAFRGNVYSEISIGDYELKDTWEESKVLYLKYDNRNLMNALRGISEDYSGLIASSIKGYQNSKARKGKLKIPTNLPKELQTEGELQKHIEKSMSAFMDPTKDAVYPESNGFEYTEISEAKGSKSNDSGREAKNFANDIFDFVAVGLGIPPSLLKGDTVDTKDAVNNFITFCINTITKPIQDEINRKMYGEKEYLTNTYVKVDTSNIKAVDLRDVANSIDLLNRNGALTIDDTLGILGKEPIGGDVGDMRFVTKNLELIDNVLKGGE